MKLYLSLCAKRELSPWPVVSDLRQCRQQAHELAHAGSRMGARARVGLLPGGQEAGRAWCLGACLREGQLLGRLGFLEVVAIRYY